MAENKENLVRNDGLQSGPVSSGTHKSDAALMEEKILEFWRENKIFEKTLKQTEGKKEFIFYEGPPTANGKPGIHHLEARAFKDAIPRYKTMQGFHVRRKGGWDTHGLAVEIQTEKKLGLNSKKAIEEYGIAKFNHECKESVWEYLDVWNKFTKRIGYWLDQENPYVTYKNDYIESVWSVLKKIDEQKLLYKDYKVVPWCPRCGTALSSHELAQGYEDVKDLSVYVKFKIAGGVGRFSRSSGRSQSQSEENLAQPDAQKSSDPAYLLAWTTTPWTLPGNVALTVGENIDYVEIKLGEEILVLAKERLSLITDPYEIIREHKGKEMIGMQYEPLFPFLSSTISKENDKSEKLKLEKAFQVYTADFVNTTDGTGIVHTAVMYGQDDFALGTKVGLPKHHLVGLDGKFLAGTGFLEGRFVREVDLSLDGKPGKPTLAVDIIEDLKKRNLFFKQENYKHSYPHCWRCKTALIYYARDSWYIRMSDSTIKKKLVSENEKINWEPTHIRNGRFGEWLREIKDWAISRERYWGTPLPVWIAEDGERLIVDSLETLRKYQKNSGNEYFMMRHGEADSNVKGFLSSDMDENNKLTQNGIEQTKRSIKKYKDFDFIFSSPISRARETSFIVANALGIAKNQIIFDERILEIQWGDLNGKSGKGYMQYREARTDYFSTPFPGGESHLSVHKRMGDFIYELEKKYSNKKILIISHGDPIRALFLIAKGYTKEKIREQEKDFTYLKTSEIRELDFTPLPHDENYELDLHRPFIDEVVLVKGGKEFRRVKDVMDVWFDSGSMPFAQDHYPFENRKWVEGSGYPADFICEAIDQTRGWFYTLHAIGILSGRGRAYKNVICLGHLLDASGKKMSKSVGNIVDPWLMMEKYGVDTLRLWMYSINQPGESKNFDEKTVALLSNQVFGLLYNVLAFYELYRDRSLESDAYNLKPKNILDQWILVRLDELVKLSTENLDSYKLLEPVRGMRDFIGDLSTWYLRRSRDRIKESDKEAKQILYFVLITLAKIMAPFAPFTAEDIWLKLKTENDSESVHLEKWPTVSQGFLNILTKKKTTILKDMKIVREIVTLGLEARQKAGIKVRQPLNQLRIKNYELGGAHIELIKDELNLREAVFDNSILGEVELDTNITRALKAEGEYRELVRAIQDMRKKMGLTPSDVIELTLETNEKGKELIQKFEIDMKKTVLVSQINFKDNDGQEIKIDGLVFKVKIEQ